MQRYPAFLLCAVLALLCAAHSATAASDNQGAFAAQHSATAASLQALEPQCIADDAGKRICLPAPARRIVPLYAGLGEMLSALGLEDSVVGRTASDDALPASLPVVGTHMRPNPEIIVGLDPDLVVQFEGREEAGQSAVALERLGLRVARFRIASFEDMFSCLRRLATLAGVAPRAEALERSLRGRLDAVAARTAKADARLFAKNLAKNATSASANSSASRAERAVPRIFFEIRYPNLLGAGAGGIAHDIIVKAGGVNSLGHFAGRVVRVSEETLVANEPDIYLVQQGPMNKDPLLPKKRPHFKRLRSVSGGYSLLVDESTYSRPGPRNVDAVEELARLIDVWRANPPGGFVASDK